MAKPRIAFMIDKGFAFKIIAEQVAHYLGRQYDFTISSDRDPAAVLTRRYDIVHFLAWDRWQRVLSSINSVKHKTKAKFIAGIHSFRSWDDGWQQEVLLLDAIAVTCKELQEIFICSGKPVYLLPNGVDVEMFYPTKRFPKQFSVGFIGAKDSIKGFNEFIVPLAEELNLPLITNEKRLGYAKGLAALYKRMSCYICASESEGFCMPLIEASATGLPVISTRVGIAEEFIEDGYSGILIDRDYQQMREAVLHLIANPTIAQEMGHRARQRSLHYSWNRIVQCYHVLYQKVLSSQEV